MIKCELEQLPKQQDERLRAWLGQGELKLLASVVEGRVKWYLSLALNDAIQSQDGNLKIDAANAHLQKAKVYDNFLTVLEELATRRETYEIAKLS